MPRAAALVVCLVLSAGAVLACTTEETMTATLQAREAGVQVAHRFAAPYAQQFLALFAQVTEVGEPPPVDLVVLYAKPGAVTHKVVAFFEGCMRGHGDITRDAYTAILGQLRLALRL